MMSGEGIAAIIVSLGTFIAQINTIFKQNKQAKLSAANSEKLDAQGGQIAEVHAATTAIVDATGAHPALKSE